MLLSVKVSSDSDEGLKVNIVNREFHTLNRVIMLPKISLSVSLSILNTS